MLQKIILLTYYSGNWIYYKLRIPIIKQLFWIIYKIWNFIFIKATLGVDIPAECKIGRGLKLPHNGNGVVIHANAVIGDNVTIYHQVTIGGRGSANGFSKPGVPKIGNNVLIGAGAKILGPVIIGDGASIGANAVVINDVPTKATVVGVPAKVVKIKD